MTPFDVPAARALCDAATKGPWTSRHRHCDGDPRHDDEMSGLGLEVDGPPEPMLRGQFERAADAAFIAASRTLLPAALDEIERLRKELDGYAKECLEVENALGAALGFPRYCDDKKNFPHATEKDGYCVGEHLPGTLAQAAAAEIERLRAALAVERKACDEWRALYASAVDPKMIADDPTGGKQNAKAQAMAMMHDARRAGENK